MNAMHTLGPAVGILVASLSTAAAQNERQPTTTPPPPRVSQPRAEQAATVAALLDRMSNVRGYDIVNAATESVGSVQDLIIDRGSGRVEYVLMKSGGVLGIGGKTIAVPFARLSAPSLTERRFMTDITKEQAEQAAAFVPENWSDLRRDPWADRMHTKVARSDLTSSEKNDADTDPTATAIAAAMEEALGGEVVAVKREWSGRSEDVIVELRTNDGKVRDLQLGPSWWVMSQPSAPMRGDKVEAKVRVITKDGANPRYIVSNATVDGKTLVLRDSQFRPAWNVANGATTDDARRSDEPARAATSRLVLASEIIGAKAVALDKEGGDIEDAIMDVRSGTILALCVDPNDSTLGWGDTIRSVPWSATTFGADEKVHIDATQQMLTAAPEIPKDLNAQPTWVSSVYQTFGVPAPRLERSWDASSRDRTMKGDDSSWIAAALSGPTATFSGTASRPRNEAIGKSNAQIHVVTLTSGNRVEEVVIAPYEYASTNQLAPTQGEQIEVSGRIMTLDGRRYIVAQKITRAGRTTDIWSGDKPGWLKR